MNAAPSGAGAATRLAIEGEMTIYRAAELKRDLLAALADAAVLEVDLAAVSEFDCAGVQLLMLARQAARADGRELRLAGHSAAVREVFELLKLDAWFGAPLASEASDES